MKFEELYKHDKYANDAGVTLVELNSERARMCVKVEARHLNGAATAHGGLLFLLADITMAAMANHMQPVSVSIQSDIRFLSAAFEGDTLTAEAVWIHGGKRLSNCRVDITKQSGEKVAVAEGMFHTIRSSKG